MAESSDACVILKLYPMYSRRLELFVEFLLLGIAVGLIEDLLAIVLTTGEPITWRVVAIALAVALPFAALGELIVDRKHLIPVRQSLRKSSRRKRPS
jgi:hypothetical protein